MTTALAVTCHKSGGSLYF